MATYVIRVPRVADVALLRLQSSPVLMGTFVLRFSVVPECLGLLASPFLLAASAPRAFLTPPPSSAIFCFRSC